MIKTTKPTYFEWIFAGVVFFIFFSCYLYTDICQTTAAGLNVWNSLTEGQFLNFYNYHYRGVEGSYIPNGVTGGSYDLFIYFIFAIYNFPLWVFEKISGVSFLDLYFGRLYMKCILLVFTAITAIFVKKIVTVLTENESLSWWSSFLFAFSEMTISTIVVIGGYDIISVCFSTIGVYFYFKNKHAKFMLFFAMAIACKLFAVWIFVPLILLQQKKVIRILFDGITGISIVAIPKMVFFIGHWLDKVHIANVDNGVIAHANIIVDKLFCGNPGPISFGNIPLFFAVTFVIWWFCWKKEACSKYEIIFLCIISMTTFFLFAGTYPYWIILLAPYIILVLVLNPQNIEDNVLLEAIFSFGYIIYNACSVRHCFSLNMIVYMLKPGRFPIQGDFDYVDYGLNSFMTKISAVIGIDMNNLESLFSTAFAIGLIIFLYNNRPQQYKENICTEINFRKYAWIRVALCLCVAFIPFIGVIEYYI